MNLTPINKNFSRALLLIASLVTTIIQAGINLAYDKQATQSSDVSSTLGRASNAVDGNTDGNWYNNSTTSTKSEQGAWWQVDLGSKKIINQIIIYNRTDCCADRLKSYRVSISSEEYFRTNTYQQDFYVVPNPKNIIRLDAQDKQGRYVRIQLLDKNHLSLAEVQVIGGELCSSKIKNWRFPEVGYSSAHNDFGGTTNALNYPNMGAFAVLDPDGSITAWGGSNYGGVNPPTGGGYTKIYSAGSAFAALKADGTIATWGDPDWGGKKGAPKSNGYIKISSTLSAFAALRVDGTIATWGETYSENHPPIDNGYIEIYSAGNTFAALKANGTITAWGGSANAPTDSGYTKIYSNISGFAALKIDGSITTWGDFGAKSKPTPRDSGYIRIYSTNSAFAALKADGSITVWGNQRNGGSNAPRDSGYTKIYSTDSAFAALKADGSITVWGNQRNGGSNALSVE